MKGTRETLGSTRRAAWREAKHGPGGQLALRNVDLRGFALGNRAEQSLDTGRRVRKGVYDLYHERRQVGDGVESHKALHQPRTASSGASRSSPAKQARKAGGHGAMQKADAPP